MFLFTTSEAKTVKGPVIRHMLMLGKIEVTHARVFFLFFFCLFVYLFLLFCFLMPEIP